MLNKNLIEITEEFYKKYPQAEQIRIEFTEFTQGALAIIVHGVINVSKWIYKTIGRSSF